MTRPTWSQRLRGIVRPDGPQAARRDPCGVILMYHRIAPRSVDPWELEVTPGNFASHLEIIRRIARPIPLRQFVHELATGGLEPRSVAVTFDDGYADNLHTAAPLLHEAGVPATVFVTTGSIGTTREFWWDQLDRAVLLPSRLPNRLQLTIDGIEQRWKIGDAVEGAWQEDTGTRASQARLRLHHEIWALIRPLPDAERDEVITRLFEWSGGPTIDRDSRRVMTAAEITAIASAGSIEIGAHSVTHALLPALPRETMLREISDSKATLETITSTPVTTFSYPFGVADPPVVAATKRAQFTCAVTVDQMPVGASTDPWRLPRFDVKDWDAADFERRLTGCLSGGRTPSPRAR